MFRSIIVANLLLLGSMSVHAADDANKIVTDALHKVAPNAHVQSVTESAISGFYAVMADGHPVFVSTDGKYLIEGHVYDIDAHHDIMDDGMSVVRKQAMA